MNVERGDGAGQMDVTGAAVDDAAGVVSVGLNVEAELRAEEIGPTAEETIDPIGPSPDDDWLAWYVDVGLFKIEELLLDDVEEDLEYPVAEG